MGHQLAAASVRCRQRRGYASSSGCCLQKSSRMMSQCSTQASSRSLSTNRPSAVSFWRFTLCRITTDPCSQPGRQASRRACRRRHMTALSGRKP